MNSNIYITSIYGQQYQCRIPEVQDEEERKREEEQAVETGIIDLLKPMKESPCLIHTKDWWTYEFCFGESIKQYHLEGEQLIIQAK